MSPAESARQLEERRQKLLADFAASQGAFRSAWRRRGLSERWVAEAVFYRRRVCELAEQLAELDASELGRRRSRRGNHA